MGCMSRRRARARARARMCVLIYSYIFHLTLYIANISIIILTKSIIDYLARVTPFYIFVTYSHRKNDYKNLL